ncbi:MAG: lasso peptide biosynthesis B2 protein [Chloroflexi bacterium]|nr:lasso peptide biosynthesis B2 protein [Chloroflexota bacterium]
MFDRLIRGLRYTVTIMSAIRTAPKRELLARMMAFSRALPQQFSHPLPEMMAQLTPGESANGRAGESAKALEKEASLTPDDIRRLADAVAAWHINSPLGICLRRSLLRYHFLRQAGLPVSLVFGARLKDSGAGGGIGGHAWLTLNGAPYYENPDDYAGFVEMYTYPVDKM